MKTKIIQNIKSFILVLILVLGVSYAYANFTAPTQAPPGCPTGSPGCDTPLNVALGNQIKQGTLWIKGLTSTGTAVNGLIVENGSVGIGTINPATGTKLDVNGKIKATGLQITPPSGTSISGKVLKFSDDTGNVTWGDATTTGSSVALASLCNTVHVPNVSNNKSSLVELSLLIDGENICSDDNGCSYRLWDLSPDHPEGLNFYTDSAIMYRQASDGTYLDAYGNSKGINGSGASKKFLDWPTGLMIYADYTSVAGEDSYRETSKGSWTLRNYSVQGQHTYIATVCDL